MTTEFAMQYDAASTSPRDVVLGYLDMMWNQSDHEACRRYLAEYQWRHDFMNVAEPVQRVHIDANVKRARAAFKVAPRQHYLPKIVTVDGDDVTVVWEAVWHDCNVEALEKLGYEVAADRTVRMAGIELFRVRSGKIVEIWNAYAPSIVTWGEAQT